MSEIIYFKPEYLFDEDEMPEYLKGVWHCITHNTGDPSLLCSGDMFEDIESIGHASTILSLSENDAYIIKENTKRGEITCKKCVEKLKFFRSFKI